MSSLDIVNARSVTRARTEARILKTKMISRKTTIFVSHPGPFSMIFSLAVLNILPRKPSGSSAISALTSDSVPSSVLVASVASLVALSAAFLASSS